MNPRTTLFAAQLSNANTFTMHQTLKSPERIAYKIILVAKKRKTCAYPVSRNGFNYYVLVVQVECGSFRQMDWNH